MVFRHIQTHAGQLQLQLAGGVAAIVGEKKIFFFLSIQPVDKFSHTGQDDIAVVDDTVHVADKAFFAVKVDLCHRVLLDNYKISCY